MCNEDAMIKLHEVQDFLWETYRSVEEDSDLIGDDWDRGWQAGVLYAIEVITDAIDVE